MSTLLVDELVTTLTQTITVTSERVVAAIRPHIYKAGSPAGSLKVAIKSGSTELASKTLTVAEIEAGITNNNTYYHGFINFQFDSFVHLPAGDYDIVISGVGYTFDTNTYIGWCVNYEDQINANTTDPTTLIEYPYEFQIWRLR